MPFLSSPSVQTLPMSSCSLQQIGNQLRTNTCFKNQSSRGKMKSTTGTVKPDLKCTVDLGTRLRKGAPAIQTWGPEGSTGGGQELAGSRINWNAELLDQEDTLCQQNKANSHKRRLPVTSSGLHMFMHRPVHLHTHVQASHTYSTHHTKPQRDRKTIGQIYSRE